MLLYSDDGPQVDGGDDLQVTVRTVSRLRQHRNVACSTLDLHGFLDGGLSEVRGECCHVVTIRLHGDAIATTCLAACLPACAWSDPQPPLLPEPPIAATGQCCPAAQGRAVAAHSV